MLDTHRIHRVLSLVMVLASAMGLSAIVLFITGDLVIVISKRVRETIELMGIVGTIIVLAVLFVYSLIHYLLKTKRSVE